MRPVVRRSFVIVAAACAAGCASGAGNGHLPVGGAEACEAARPDTAGALDHDAWFVEIHADLVRRTALLAQAAPGDPRLVEIRSIMETAEEYYLEGRTLIAIRLLTEAEALLRTDP